MTAIQEANIKNEALMAFTLLWVASVSHIRTLFSNYIFALVKRIISQKILQYTVLMYCTGVQQ